MSAFKVKRQKRKHEGPEYLTALPEGIPLDIGGTGTAVVPLVVRSCDESVLTCNSSSSNITAFSATTGDAFSYFFKHLEIPQSRQVEYIEHNMII